MFILGNKLSSLRVTNSRASRRTVKYPKPTKLWREKLILYDIPGKDSKEHNYCIGLGEYTKSCCFSTHVAVARVHLWLCRLQALFGKPPCFFDATLRGEKERKTRSWRWRYSLVYLITVGFCPFMDDIYKIDSIICMNNCTDFVFTL